MLTGQAMPIVEAGKATHTTLDCTNLQASLRFYHEVLGLRVEQNGPKSGLLSGTNLEMYAAVIEVPRLSPQPLLNYYARPVRDAATVDVVSDRLRTVQMQYGIRQMTAPAREDPAHFWVGTYGFYLEDTDGNWWRIEENAGPFGPADIPPDAESRHSIVPAGPISYVTLECRELAPTLQFYRDFLGVDVDQRAPHYFVSRSNGGVHLVVVAVGDGLTEQAVMNRHGITVWADRAEVNRVRDAAERERAAFGIQRVMPVTEQHGS